MQQFLTRCSSKSLPSLSNSFQFPYTDSQKHCKC